MRYLIDTSVLIDHLRGGQEWNKFVGSIDKDSEIFISTVVVFELFSGLSTKGIKEAGNINNLQFFMKPVDLTWSIAKKAGELYRDSKNKYDFPDYTIAATAMEIGAYIVTLNKKHFSKIPNLMLYPL